MSDTVERIRSEDKLVDLQVVSSAQSSKGFESTWNMLSKKTGDVMTIDKSYRFMNAEKDKDGIAELKLMASGQK